MKHTTEFICCARTFEKPTFIQHLVDDHKFVRGTQCSRMANTFLDGAKGAYQQIYDWEIPCPSGVVKAQQINRGTPE